VGLEEFGTNLSHCKSAGSVGGFDRAVEGSSLGAEPSDRRANYGVGDGPFVQWTDAGTGIFYAAPRTVQRLPAGAYEPVQDPNGVALFRKEILTDDLVNFPGSVSERVIAEVDAFWEQGEMYRKLGFLHRRGFLFYGPQGTGKSSIVNLLVADIIRRGHIAVFCSAPGTFATAVRVVRRIDPDRPILCVFEDIDAIVQRYGEERLLQWLDGADQVDRCVSVATTNYPERLDPRLVSRPRRFDWILKVDALPDFVRRRYLAGKLREAGDGTLHEAELDVLVERTEDLPFAALAELVIALKCHGLGLEDTLERLREMTFSPPRDPYLHGDGAFGFSRSRSRSTRGNTGLSPGEDTEGA
jgi:hypothetical protein